MVFSLWTCQGFPRNVSKFLFYSLI